MKKQKIKATDKLKKEVFYVQNTRYGYGETNDINNGSLYDELELQFMIDNFQELDFEFVDESTNSQPTEKVEKPMYRIETKEGKVVRKKATRPYTKGILCDNEDGSVGVYTLTVDRDLKIEEYMTRRDKNVRIEEVVSIRIK